jgi:hypothetical protein
MLISLFVWVLLIGWRFEEASCTAWLLLLHHGNNVCDELERSVKEMVVVADFSSLSPVIRVAQLIEALRY